MPQNLRGSSHFSRPSWSIAYGHGVYTQSVPAPTLALDLHTHTVALPAAAWAEVWRGVSRPAKLQKVL